ncbi:DUF4214 domain-containing protein [Ramlibacter sp. PS4R-6]|uniref:DUF4214 domain-containing protein n=1 Tax=Ramlibacter sp. PS4R-6 TaxID=3133438 RepID=UPI0030AA2E4B
MAIQTGTSGNDAFVAHPAIDYQKGQLVFVLGGIPAGGEWPKIGVLINGQWTATATIDAYVINGNTQTVTVQLPTGTITSVGLQYFNDGSVGSENRDLYIGSASLNGVNLPLNQGTYAIDGASPIPGQNEIYRNGTLTWSGSVVSNAMATSAKAENNDITGGAGFDVVSYTGKELPLFDFKYQADGSMTVESYRAGFKDTLHGIENILFDDTSGSGANATVDAAGRVIDGGRGLDTLVLFGHTDQYYVSHTATGVSIYGNGVDEWITNVERVQFTNGFLAFDINGNAGMAYRLYQAAFDRKPDVGGLSYWIHAIDGGQSVRDAAAYFATSPEFNSKYGPLDNQHYAAQLYTNVLHRTPDAGGLQYWVDSLNKGTSRAEVLIGFSESAENQANVIGVIEDGIYYTL